MIKKLIEFFLGERPKKVTLTSEEHHIILIAWDVAVRKNELSIDSIFELADVIDKISRIKYYAIEKEFLFYKNERETLKELVDAHCEQIADIFEKVPTWQQQILLRDYEILTTLIQKL